jgi:hypothetical protein
MYLVAMICMAFSSENFPIWLWAMMWIGLVVE